MKESIIFVLIQIVFIYYILGYHFDLPLTKKLYLNLPVNDTYEKSLIIFIAVLSMSGIMYYRKKGYTFKKDYSVFYIFFLLPSAYAYFNMWFTGDLSLSILLWIIGFLGTWLVYWSR